MLDSFYQVPDKGIVQRTIYGGGDPSGGSGPMTEYIDMKPRGVTWFMAWGVGAGGDGGAGAAGGGAGGGGGGGGGSGAFNLIISPAYLLPDYLKVSIGKSGWNSAISLSEDTANTFQNNDLLWSFNCGANGTAGGTPTAASGGAGGAGGTASALSTNNLGGFCFQTSVAGQDGTSGGSGAALGTPGGDITYPTTGIFVTGGAGGGGAPVLAGNGKNGGSITGSLSAIPLFPTLSGGSGAVFPANGGLGANGSQVSFDLARPFFFGIGGSGGGGGSNSSPSTGSGGGNGGIGCGGGGQGGSNNVASSGSPGKGGSSMIVIAWY